MVWQAAHKTYLESIQPYLEDPDISLTTCESALQLCHRHFLELLEVPRNIEFESVQEEIRFFKIVQPKVYAHRVYLKKLNSYLLRCAALGLTSQKKYVKKALASGNKIVKKNKVFYEYTLLEKNHLDSIYFTRTGCPKSNLEGPFIFDPKCTTAHSLLLGKITGYSLFSMFILNQSENRHKSIPFKNPHSLKWTGQKVDLIELIYALQTAGVLDHGQGSVKKIADFFQEHFDCPLGDIYRSYSELRFRKKSRTKFLDQLSEQLQKKMDTDDF